MDSAPVVPRPPRPTVVTVAGHLQLAAVGILLLMAGTMVVMAVRAHGAIDRAARISGVDPELVSLERTSNIVTTAIWVVPTVLFTVCLAACLLPLRRGSNAARIWTFVAAGLLLLAGCGPVVSGFLFLPMLVIGLPGAVGWLADGDGTAAPPSSEGPDPYASEDAFYEALGYEALDVLVPVGSMAGFLLCALVVAIVVLLMLPSANRFFVPRPDRPDRPVLNVLTVLPAGVHPVPGQQHGYVYLYPYPPPAAPGGPADDPTGPVDRSEASGS